MNLSPQLIGISAGILTATSLLPQVFKTIRDKKAEHISMMVFIILLGGNGLWVYYGVLRGDWPIIVTNSFSCMVDLTMLLLKLRYGKK